MSTIVLCAGPISYRNLPIGEYSSNAMIPINGKPIVAWILDDLLVKDLGQVTIVLREQDQRLTNFLKRVYAPRMDLLLVPLSKDGSIVQSVEAGLRAEPTSSQIQIILGDTLITDRYDLEQDMVYVGQVQATSRWCLAHLDAKGFLVDLIDKPNYPPGSYIALAGFYQFVDGDYFRSCLKEALLNNETELSAIIKRYLQKYPVQAYFAKTWYDFGNIDNLIDARHHLLQSRYFNSLSIDPVLSTISKASEHNEKLQNELDWYLKLPAELKVLTPRVVSQERYRGRTRITQEYYGYPTLAELYVYADLQLDVWYSILRQVLRIHEKFRGYSSQTSPEDVRLMYLEKTLIRLGDLSEKNFYWKELLEREIILFNGCELRDFGSLYPSLCERINVLSSNASFCIIHGDFCFSNILFDVHTQIIRLIDPRGSFGNPGIYGDSRYDIAKLRHSVVSLYDYVVAGIFELEESAPGCFYGAVFANGVSRDLATAFDSMVTEIGYNLNEIKLIEGLLFISMLPLHKDSFRRQKMLYLIGLSLLNEVL